MTPLLMLAAALAAAQCDQADLTGHFMDAPGRDQCDLGSCHAFGSVGALESAIFRNNGTKIRLSEADLYVGRLAADEKFRDEFRAGEDGAYVEDNLKYAVAHGVARGGQADYEAMTSKLEAARVSDEDATRVEKINDRKRRWRRRFGKIVPQAWADRLLADDYLWGRKIDAADIEARIFGADLPRIRKERAETLALMTSFSVINEVFYQTTPKKKVLSDPISCRQASVDQNRMIESLLCRKIPVAVSMDLGGLRAWGSWDYRDDMPHAFLLTGFKRGGGGLKVFTSRNSWGFENPPVYEHELCRVYAVTAVTVPADAPQEAPAARMSVVPASIKLPSEPAAALP